MNKIKPRKISLEQFESAREDYNGFCLGCGHEQGCCEPDACKYKCDVCGERKVYGAEELLMMGLVE